MKPFKHINSDSLDIAVEILSGEENATVIAGGTDLLGTLKNRIHDQYPDIVVNLKTIDGLSYIKGDSESVRIGALTKLHDIVTNDLVNEKLKILAEAAHSVATPQIRKMATIGGNICQETRCWYYRYPDNFFDCMRKGGNVCRALLGENQFHSIFGAEKIGDTPCTSGCPANTDIPAYLCKIREGDLKAAANILLAANPMPAITGRVCPHFCQDECNRAEFDEAISIRDIERYIGDYILEHKEKFFSPAKAATGKKISIIGSGPGGLTAAFYLSQLGHQVTIFEKQEEAGGMLAFGIPAYRLPKDLVRQVVETLTGYGVEIKLNVDVGKDVLFEDILKDYDSVLLASGAWKQPHIGIEGEELTVYGLDFLKQVNSGSREAPGRKVVVIGGGDVAVDVAISAMRLGAEEVTMACLESREEMPALEWEIEQALEEQINLIPSWGPLRVIEADGKITGIELVRCTSVFDAHNRFAPEFDQSETMILETDQIILAVGQRIDVSYVGEDLIVEGGLVKTYGDNLGTNIPGVFVCGDAIGPAAVIDAIVSARKAAYGMHAYLIGEQIPQSSIEIPGTSRAFLTFDNETLGKTQPSEMPFIPIKDRKIDVEDALGLTLNVVENEVSRCLNCGCVAVSPSDIAPVLIALDARIKTSERTIDAEEFFSTRVKKSTVLNDNELVTEIQIPIRLEAQGSVYSKFRIRKSIDFPIVSVASIIHIKDSVVEDARIVLGAVAPVPVRARNAEAYLKGKKINEVVAAEAANLALQHAIPLAKNEYKVQVTKTLVKRAILEKI